MSISNERQRSPQVVQYSLEQPTTQPASMTKSVSMTTTATIVSTKAYPSLSKSNDSNCATSANGNRKEFNGSEGRSSIADKITGIGDCGTGMMIGTGHNKKPLTAKLLKTSKDDYRAFGSESSPSKQPLISKNQSSLTAHSSEHEQNSLLGGKLKRTHDVVPENKRI